jgi:hypothetical protein
MDDRVLDLEIQRHFWEMVGRHNLAALRLLCAVTGSSLDDSNRVFWGHGAAQQAAELKSADRLVGFDLRALKHEMLQP